MKKMRFSGLFRYAFILLLTFATRPVAAQLWAGLGYNMSTPLGLKNLNKVVDKYNEYRPWLDDKMKRFRYLDGLAIRFGYWKTYYFLDVGITGASQKAWAQGTQPSDSVNKYVLKRQDLKVSINTLDVCFGRLFKNRENHSYGAGIILGYGNFRVKSRRESPDDIKHQKYEDIIKENALIFGFCGRYLSSDPGIMVEPFIRFGLFGIGRANAKYVNGKLNPGTADLGTLKVHPGSFGIKVLLAVTTRK